MRSVSGLIFMIFGLVLMAGWMASIAFAPRGSAGATWEHELLRSATQFGLFFFTLLSLASAVLVMGVYFHNGEVERLLSCPFSLADLLRLLMQVDAARSLLGAVVL